MDESQYLESRLEPQINWYDDKSKHHRNWYKGLRGAEIVAAASIPFLVGFITDARPLFLIIVGLLGVAIAVITGIISLCQFQENWVEYRTTCESLKHEKYIFQTKTEPYDVDNPFPLLVHRVESMISRENTTWSQYIQPQKKEAKHG